MLTGDELLMGSERDFAKSSINTIVPQETPFRMVVADSVCASMLLVVVLSQPSFALWEQERTAVVSRLSFRPIAGRCLFIGGAEVVHLRDVVKPLDNRMSKAAGPKESPNTNKLPNSMLYPLIFAVLCSISKSLDNVDVESSPITYSDSVQFSGKSIVNDDEAELEIQKNEKTAQEFTTSGGRGTKIVESTKNLLPSSSPKI